LARILHIEDDAANRLLVRKLLTAEGHQVLDAVDGLEGVRLALHETPDLVLVDLNLPGLDGYEVTLRLRSEGKLKDTPIVAITAEGDRGTSLSVGCNGFLQKPIEARHFAKQVGAYLAGRRERMSSTVEEAEDRLRVQGGRVVARLEAKVSELSEANARLVEMDRRRTEFYRNMSHELATPMTPIVGYTTMLAADELGPLTPTQKKAVNALQASVRRLRDTLDGFADAIALEAGKMQFAPKRINAAALWAEAVAPRAEAMRKKDLVLLEDIPEGPIWALIDRPRFLRALGHLLDNAIKFSEPGGILGVALREVDDSTLVNSPGNAAGPNPRGASAANKSDVPALGASKKSKPSAAIEFLIADGGPGIAEPQRARIFEPFVQGDGSVTRVHGGAGIGLAVARRIAEGHHGRLLLGEGAAVISGMTLTGASFCLQIAKVA
jgi:signal transduction histidine kinase